MAALRAIADAAFPGGTQARLLAGDLAATEVPTAVVWGAEDSIVPAAHAGQLPDGVEVLVLDGVGHMAHMERASEVNAVIERMVASG